MPLGERGQGQKNSILVFYPNCLSEWNKLDPELRLAPSIAVFKKKLLSIVRPPAKSVFGIPDPIGLPYLTQLRVGLSKLNFHKFKHDFRDTINPMCPTNDGIEDTEHFLLLCPSFDLQRRDLLAGIVELLRPFVQIANLSNDALTQLLLYGDQDLSNDLNKNKINHIHKKALRIAYKDNVSDFDTLLTRGNSVSVHKRNLQLLMTEIYKTKSNITPSFMTEIFLEKNPPYHLRSSNILQMPKARTVRYVLESISVLGCKLWHGISTNIKQSLDISIFKKRIKEWKGDDCNCRLCKTFIAQVGFLN